MTASLDGIQQIVLYDVSWEFYEDLLQECEERHVQVTYDGGAIEIIAGAHERIAPQHFVLDDTSWEFYTRVLEEFGNRPMGIKFDQGRLEMRAPLAEHEAAKEAIGVLIDLLAADRRMKIARFGSTTFRRPDIQKGVEPDKCYYFGATVKRVRGMKEFDPAIHPAPDLAIEIDITRRSVKRQPIYALLGVPELWRFDGSRLTILTLSKKGEYDTSPQSRAFPFLPMTGFEEFVRRMIAEDQTTVQLEFDAWVKTLPR
jgi:Uma2 family endonuclease